MKKYDNKTIGKLIFRYFNIRNFEISKCQSFKILTPTLRNFKITNIKITKAELFGWGSEFGTTKCRTTNISKFQNYEY